MNKMYSLPGLSAIAQQYVKGCRERQRRKTPSVNTAGLLQAIEAPDMPFDQVKSEWTSSDRFRNLATAINGGLSR